jgi:hypothetical protein
VLGLCRAAGGLDVLRWLAAKFGVLKLDRKTNDVMAGRSRSCRPESGSSVQCPASPSFVGWPLAACNNASLRQKIDLKVGKSWNGNRFLDFVTREDVCLVLTPCLFDHLSSAFFAFLLASLAI